VCTHCNLDRGHGEGRAGTGTEPASCGQ
jgi:hypothetical protein